MSEREIEADDEHQVQNEACKADRLARGSGMPNLAYPEIGDDRRPEDIEAGEGEGLERASDETERAAVRQEAAIDHHLDCEQQDQNADLQPSLRWIRIDRRPLEAVIFLVSMPPLLHFLEVAAACMQEVLALPRLNSELGRRFDGGALDDRERSFEVERR